MHEIVGESLEKGSMNLKMISAKNKRRGEKKKTTKKNDNNKTWQQLRI